MARSAVGRQLISPFRRLTEKTQESGSLTHGLSALITPPSEYLQRVRWMLLLACLAIALFTGFIIIFVSQAILPLRVLGITALACLCWWWFRCVYCATVKDPWRFPVEALALVPAIASLENTTMAIISLAYLGVSFRAFYSTRRQMLLIVLGVSIAYLVARVLLPSGSSPLLISQVILQSFSLFVIAYALSSLSKALAKRDTAIKLESSLLQASTKLLAAQHPEEIYAVALQAVLEMFDNVQVRAGIALGTAQQMILVATRKALIPATSMHGDIVIDLRQLPAKSAAAFVNGASCELVASDVTSQISEVFVPPSGSLFVAPMIIQGTTAGAFLVGYEGPMSRARCTSLEALTRLVALALEKAEIIQDQSLKETEERFVSLVQNSSDIITIIEADSTIRYQSPSVSRILGHQEDKLIGTKLAALVHPEDAQKLTDFLNDVKLKPGRSSGIECRLRQWDGNWRHIETVGTNLLHDPSVQGILLNSRDVTERHALEGQLAQLAFHDPLTNLPNRVLFMDRLQHALLRAERSTKELAVLFLDLDNFKVVNDSMGHHAGDQLLKEVVSRLIAVLRLEDTAARFGGDEFTVLLEDFDAANSPAIVAERIQEQLQTPIKLSGQDVFVTTSIGIAISSGGMDSPDSLLRSADLAMYAAKTKGKAGYAVFDPAMNSRMMERLNLQAEMRHALDRGEFRVFYQPVVEMTTGKILEVEALVRWEHPVRGLVSPAQFIPLAEETGFIIFLGHWVLETAAYQIHNWQMHLPGNPMLTVGVNLSAKQFQLATLVEDVRNVIRNSGLEPKQLKLEITETLAMEDAEAARAKLRDLKDLGVQLAIDDFGTGYSSLSYLKRYPVDTLKIDRSFVDGLGSNTEDTAIVQTIIAVAKTLGLRVTAEGIETAQQVKQLRLMNCDLGQGYYFSRPMPERDFGLLLVNAANKGLIRSKFEAVTRTAPLLGLLNDDQMSDIVA